MTHVHHEIIKWKKGKLIGTCDCGQVRKYDPEGHDKPVILQKGNADMNKGELHRYFNTNKEQILADARALGQIASRKKWGIKSSTWVGLMKRWVPDHAPYTDVLMSKVYSPHTMLEALRKKALVIVRTPGNKDDVISLTVPKSFTDCIVKGVLVFIPDEEAGE
ncbi:MAG TPA: hypothetical protein VMW45_04535 [Dehalococcoidia bacterium]|nr:hypothetical protein [Dehalococcoidia bacterium]